MSRATLGVALLVSVAACTSGGTADSGAPDGSAAGADTAASDLRSDIADVATLDRGLDATADQGADAAADRGAEAAVGQGGTDGGNPASCPAAAPQRFGVCPRDVTGACYYADTICYCFTQARGIPSDAANTMVWACGMAPAGCPRTIPAQGSACSTPGMKCSYDFRDCAVQPSAAVCQNGVWVFTATPCSAA